MKKIIIRFLETSNETGTAPNSFSNEDLLEILDEVSSPLRTQVLRLLPGSVYVKSSRLRNRGNPGDVCGALYFRGIPLNDAKNNKLLQSALKATHHAIKDSDWIYQFKMASESNQSEPTLSISFRVFHKEEKVPLDHKKSYKEIMVDFYGRLKNLSGVEKCNMIKNIILFNYYQKSFACLKDSGEELSSTNNSGSSSNVELSGFKLFNFGKYINPNQKVIDISAKTASPQETKELATRFNSLSIKLAAMGIRRYSTINGQIKMVYKGFYFAILPTVRYSSGSGPDIASNYRIGHKPS
jgi:hypothetical protein